MKFALAHDYLTQEGGAEFTFDVMAKTFPQAPIFTMFHDLHKVPAFAGRDIRTSFLQSAPAIRSKFQWYLPLMPLATESLDLSEYDVVLSSTSAFFKGLITQPDTRHICYCHTPTRYLWTDTHDYVNELRLPGFIKRAVIPPTLTKLRIWDRLAADRVDLFLANSKAVQQRIAKFYRRESQILYPPVDTAQFTVSDRPKTYFLAGGRLVAYKRYDLIIEAFNRIGLPLKIFGTGPLEETYKTIASPHVEFLGKVSQEQKRELYANCIAYIHPQEEDFGITLVEATASGRPVIAYAKGGALETVVDGTTGTLFEHQTWEDLAHTVLAFDHTRFNPPTIRTHAQQFSIDRFVSGIKQIVGVSI